MAPLSELGVGLAIGDTGSKGGGWGNANLVGLDLRMLEVIHGEISIWHNAALASLDDLDALATIDGDSALLLNPERVLEIYENGSLPMEEAFAFAARFPFNQVGICNIGGD